MCFLFVVVETSKRSAKGGGLAARNQTIGARRNRRQPSGYFHAAGPSGRSLREPGSQCHCLFSRCKFVSNRAFDLIIRFVLQPTSSFSVLDSGRYVSQRSEAYARGEEHLGSEIEFRFALANFQLCKTLYLMGHTDQAYRVVHNALSNPMWAGNVFQLHDMEGLLKVQTHGVHLAVWFLRVCRDHFCQATLLTVKCPHDRQRRVN